MGNIKEVTTTPCPLVDILSLHNLRTHCHITCICHLFVRFVLHAVLVFVHYHFLCSSITIFIRDVGGDEDED